MISKPPVVLIIMDGWGTTAPSVGNALTGSNLKYWDYLLNNYPSSLLQASGAAVGLPWGKMGNSEVGHLTIGAGRIYLQSLENINQQISKGEFFENAEFLKAITHVKNNDSNLHLIGLIGSGGVHAHQNHLLSLLDLAAKNNLHTKTYLHLFLDGRDAARDSSLGFMEELYTTINELNCGQVASVGGRFYGMDRNKNWDRIQKAFEVMVGKSNNTKEDPIKAIKESYKEGVFDEEFIPITIMKNGNPVGEIKDNDAIIFFNYRADRARQLTQVFVEDEFSEFDRGQKINNLYFVGFTEYKQGLKMGIAFPKPKIEYPLARMISDGGLKQLHVAETEKYAHITFFINGLREEEFPGESRILIPSPGVESYAEQPEMSAFKIRDSVLKALDNKEFDFIVINFANPDMVGHTGDLAAGKRAVEVTSECVREVVEATIKQGGQAIVTADHGNVEEMVSLETGSIDKEHSNFPVPVILVNNEYKGRGVARQNSELYTAKIQGALVDIAPTVLGMLGVNKHESMIGIDLNKVII